MNVLSKTKLDTVHSEYGEIVNVSGISNSIAKIYDVWNESDIEQFLIKDAVNVTSVCSLMTIEI